MRAIGVNRRPADNRLAAAVPTARRKVDALGGNVPRTATDQRRAVKAARSGRLTEAVAPAPGAVRHAGAGRGTRARPCRCLRPAADPSLPSPGPLLDRGLDAAEPHIRSPLVAAGTKIPHARRRRARKGGTNLYRGVSQPGRYPVRPPGSAEVAPSPMAGTRRPRAPVRPPS